MLQQKQVYDVWQKVDVKLFEVKVFYNVDIVNLNFVFVQLQLYGLNGDYVDVMDVGIVCINKQFVLFDCVIDVLLVLKFDEVWM